MFIRVWVGITRDGNYPGAKGGGQGATHLSQRGKVVNDYTNLESEGHPHRTCDLVKGPSWPTLSIQEDSVRNKSQASLFSLLLLAC